MNTFKKIIQPNSYSCYPACVAMATGSTIEEVFEFCGHDGSDNKPFTDYEMMRFMLEKFYTLGVFIYPGSIKKGQDELELHISLKYPAILDVESKKFKNFTQMIYWDGSDVYDPSPEANDNLGLRNYNIITWLFVSRIFPPKRESKVLKLERL